jgi:hypothetical protein
MHHTYEFQGPILANLLMEPWCIATMPNLQWGRTQFNIWTGRADSRVVTLEIEPTSISGYDSIRGNFVSQLDANSIPHR